MENLYNAVLSFKGEGSFTFSLPRYGELTIYTGRDIFVKGLNIAGVEAIRQLRPLLLEHKLNGKSDGCYKVIDLTTLDNSASKILNTPLSNPIQPVKSVADLKAEMIKTTGPIVEELTVEETEESKVEETEEPKVEEPTVEESVKTAKKPAKRNTKRNTRKKSK